MANKGIWSNTCFMDKVNSVRLVRVSGRRRHRPVPHLFLTGEEVQHDGAKYNHLFSSHNNQRVGQLKRADSTRQTCVFVIIPSTCVLGWLYLVPYIAFVCAVCTVVHYTHTAFLIRNIQSFVNIKYTALRAKCRRPRLGYWWASYQMKEKQVVQLSSFFFFFLWLWS